MNSSQNASSAERTYGRWTLKRRDYSWVNPNFRVSSALERDDGTIVVLIRTRDSWRPLFKRGDLSFFFYAYGSPKPTTSPLSDEELSKRSKELGLLSSIPNQSFSGTLSSDGSPAIWFGVREGANPGTIAFENRTTDTSGREVGGVTEIDSAGDYDWSFSKATIVNGVSVKVTRGLDTGEEVEANFGSDGRDVAGDATPNDTLTIEGWEGEVHHASSGGGTTPPPLPAAITLSQVGSIFGSTLGNYLAGDNTFAKIAAGSALSAVLSTVGGSFDRYFGLDGAAPAANFETAIEQGFSRRTSREMKVNAVYAGMLSSFFLTAARQTARMRAVHS